MIFEKGIVSFPWKLLQFWTPKTRKMGKTKKWLYLRKWGKIDKTKLLKFEKKKWSYFFPICHTFWDMAVLWIFLAEMSFQQRKWPYLRKYGKSEKSKTTLLSQTFQVTENEFPLFFSFLASRPRYWPVFTFGWDHL